MCVPAAALADAPLPPAPKSVLAMQVGVIRMSGQLTPIAVQLSYQRGRAAIFHLAVVAISDSDESLRGVGVELGGGRRFTSGAAEVEIVGGLTANGAIVDTGATGDIGPFLALRGTLWASSQVGLTVTATGRAAFDAPEERLLGSVVAGVATRW